MLLIHPSKTHKNKPTEFGHHYHNLKILSSKSADILHRSRRARKALCSGSPLCPSRLSPGPRARGGTSRRDFSTLAFHCIAVARCRRADFSLAVTRASRALRPTEPADCRRSFNASKTRAFFVYPHFSAHPGCVLMPVSIFVWSFYVRIN